MFKLLILNVSVLLAVLILIFNPSLSQRIDGLTLTTNYASFYIPASKGVRVYVFNPKPKELEEIIKETSESAQSTLGVVVKNLSTGQQVTLNNEEEFTSASLYKLPVMYTIFKKGEKGFLDLNAKDVQNNLDQMISISSNEAAIYLVENYTGWKEVTDTMISIGLKKTNLNKVPPTTTPSDIAKLLEIIAKSQPMIDLLSEQKINDRIPVHLPPTTIVAHKTGELDDVRHDAGVIITPENNYILVLMSKDSDNPELIKPVMADLSKNIHDFFTKQWANPPEILGIESIP